jgi:hypothetical protein
MSAVLIRGDGIAATCCSRLLADASVPVAVESIDRPKLPAIMIGEVTQRLLGDVFHRADIFDGLPRIRRRIVLWGRESKPVVLPHSAVVVSEQELWYRIRQRFPQNTGYSDGGELWTIFASVPLGPSSTEHHFGSRMAEASLAELKPGHDSEACWIESLESGWLFLLPTGKGTGWLLSVGNSADARAGMSSLVKTQIAKLHPSRGTFATHPRTAFPLAGPRWLACGTAAIGFDPLCGDGTGNAIREAILASAVIRAAIAGAGRESLAAHYQTRLIAGLQRHIALCYEFYKSGHAGLWWDDQLHDLERGLAWCRLHTRENSGSELQNCQTLPPLTEHDLQLLTHFVNSF